MSVNRINIIHENKWMDYLLMAVGWVKVVRAKKYLEEVKTCIILMDSM